MLRRVDTAQLVHTPGLFGKGPFALVIGRRSAPVANQRKWSAAQVRDFLAYAEQWPAFIARLDGRNYWTLRGRVFSDNEQLTQEQVWALLLSREQQRKRQIDRAVATAYQGERPASSPRGHIPDEVKHYVWNRDQGRCRTCGTTSELQFDHIIPIAMGGSSEPENLQILCGPCNRRKGAGLV